MEISPPYSRRRAQAWDAVMPRFFFNIRDGDQILYDLEGTELATLDAARHEALVDARWILAEELRAGGVTLERQFEITDDARQILAMIRFQDALHQPLDGTMMVPSASHAVGSNAGAVEG
jgi:hypothetical protein